jgi:glycosyltransferase involved in cell wall biosynthesis
VRILFDGFIFSSSHTGGIARYFTNLISRLPESVEPWVTTIDRPGLHFPRHSRLQVRRFPRFRPNRISALFERAYFGSISRRNTFDIAHPTYYNLLSGRRLGQYSCPSVITVHDMIGEIFTDGSRSDQLATAIKREAVDDAQRIICISQNTKHDLIEVFGVSADKIDVVYLASDLNLAMAGGDEFVPERPYFLYIGGHAWRYKNFDRFLRSFAKVVPRHSDAMLCIVGPPLSPKQLERIELLGLSDHVHETGRVSDSHLVRLYNRSVALVYPSLYEGFGIPPLEAMACETAVIASNRSSIPEVVGDAALLVDPESEEELAAAMTSILEDSARREEFIRRGREREKLFSWDKMAAEIQEIYRKVANK